ncbi:hypothetical protein ACIA5D_07610 [Actinoplanes sp. NPDC051513]|uniref:hypothetical protein n=1 Tax=Actinoplanes sp. NPDC051513 TaxID=3363908 RepID=UPI00378AFE9C
MCSACEPLLMAGRRVVVDGHPICASCGAAAVPCGPGRWRHLAPGEAYPFDSPWLRPPGWDEFASLTTFAAYAARCPDVVVTEGDWLAARARWLAYAESLGHLPMADLAGMLAGGTAGPGSLRVPAAVARVLDLDARRRELASLYSWAIPSPAALGLIGSHGPLVEVGAGTGYWASLLSAAGADVVATDIAPPGQAGNAYHRAGRTWFPVAPMPAVEAVRAHPGRTLLLCWPPPLDDSAGYAAVRAYRGDTLVLIGGDADGPAGTPRLHRELDLNWTVTEELALPSWPGIPDRVTVWQRNRRRRPLRVRDRCPACARFVPTGATGRCDRCVATRPAALTTWPGGRRVEYTAATLAAMPPALREALRRSSAAAGVS